MPRAEGERLEQPQSGHGNLAAKANVDIATLSALALMIVAVIEMKIAVLPKAQWQRQWIERTEDSFRDRLSRLEMGQVNVPERAGFIRLGDELIERAGSFAIAERLEGIDFSQVSE